MKYWETLTICVIAGMLAGCSASKKEELAHLKKEVMELHDEVMPKMGELRKTQKELLTRAGSPDTDSLAAAEYEVLARRMEDANESMMDWMRNFDPGYEGSEEEVGAYLQEQKEQMLQVKEDMLSALKEGKRALQ